jgi:hypothetical protein
VIDLPLLLGRLLYLFLSPSRERTVPQIVPEVIEDSQDDEEYIPGMTLLSHGYPLWIFENESVGLANLFLGPVAPPLLGD